MGDFWIVIGTIAAVVAAAAGVYAAWKMARGRRENTAQIVETFMSDLRGRHVLYEPLAHEDSEGVARSLEQIRTEATNLGAVLTGAQRADADAIREASRETALAIREHGLVPHTAKALNSYRAAIAPPVRRLCTAFNITPIPTISQDAIPFSDDPKRIRIPKGQ